MDYVTIFEICTSYDRVEGRVRAQESTLLVYFSATLNDRGLLG